MAKKTITRTPLDLLIGERSELMIKYPFLPNCYFPVHLMIKQMRILKQWESIKMD